MSRKRRNTSSPELDDSSDSKRLRSLSPDYDESDEDFYDEQPQVDSSSGQTGAFPGLNHARHDMFYGPAADGIDYLHMVRSEARGVPHVLRDEQKELKLEEDRDNIEGWFYDGTYTSMPVREPESQIPLSQAYYYHSLLGQFHALQQSLLHKPPLTELAKLSELQLISFPGSNAKASQKWEEIILSTNPNPVQMASMDIPDVFQLIQLTAKKIDEWLRPRGNQRIRRLSVWIWAILGRCPHPGELASEQMADIRLLGRKAAEHLEKWSAEMQEVRRNGREQHSTSEHSDVERPEGFLEDWMSRSMGLDVMLDMIITVVGEVYGQRDLLGHQLIWPKALLES